MKLIDSITKYTSRITNDGMVLWAAGYAVGLMLGFFFSLATVIVTTLMLTVVFGLIKLHSDRQHGRRVNVAISVAVLEELNRIIE